jgi:hypothetical protein
MASALVGLMQILGNVVGFLLVTVAVALDRMELAIAAVAVVELATMVAVVVRVSPGPAPLDRAGRSWPTIARTAWATDVLRERSYVWLVVSRRGPGHTPWYLLTNECADTPAAAWKIIFAYARRWQIEMAWRFNKSELAMESPRLWFWENRIKLLLMVSLAYAFLLSLLDPLLKHFRDTLLQRFCPRTGKRSRDSPTPLYRIRIALDYLWLCTGPPFLGLRESSG